MEQASYLVKNWIHMRWHTEFDFWNEFYNNLPEQLKKYSIVDAFLFNSKSIDNSVHSSRNRSFDYGIALNLFEYKEESICILIERGQQYLEYGIVVATSNFTSLLSERVSIGELKNLEFSF